MAGDRASLRWVKKTATARRQWNAAVSASGSFPVFPVQPGNFADFPLAPAV
jgi:hypothetical protein